MLGDRKARVKIPTTLRVGTMNWVRGQKVDLFAVLRTTLGTGVRGATLRFELWDTSPRVLVSEGSGVTNQYGRAHCVTAIPQAIGSGDYEVKAFFSGSKDKRSASATGRILVQSPAHHGQLTWPNSPRISMAAKTNGTVRQPTSLRAVLTEGNAPVTRGRVHFNANGRYLGTATPNPAGIAKVVLRLPARHMSNLTHYSTQAPPYWIGGIQAWWEPPAGDRSGPVAIVRQVRIFEAISTCDALNQPPNKCNIKRQSPSIFQVLNPARIRVRKDEFGAGLVREKARFRFAMAQPPDPSPNADCNPRAFSGAARFCRRSCSRLEYSALQDTGHLTDVLGTTPARCGWTLTKEVSPSERGLKDAHDACALAVAGLGRSTWHHTVRLTFPYRQTARFKFRDPHTVGSRGNWRARLVHEEFIRETTINIPIIVNCR